MPEGGEPQFTLGVVLNTFSMTYMYGASKLGIVSLSSLKLVYCSIAILIFKGKELWVFM